jgi:hypothetical protein
LVFVPDSVGVVSARALVLLLRMVTTSAVLLATNRSPKVRVLGERVNGGSAVTV